MDLQPVNLLPAHGEVLLYEDVFSPALFDIITSKVTWKQENIKIFGKVVAQPRLTAWYAVDGKAYKYSGLQLSSNKWFSELESIRKTVSDIAGCPFNSVLINLYRDGNDTVGWHRDNEKELGQDPVIASVSFGATRKFQLRDYKNKKPVITVELMNGSVLVMKGETQTAWEHRVPRSGRVIEPRINLTFRNILI